MAKPRGFSKGFGRGFGVGRYRYELVPWTWFTSPFPHWGQPVSVVGAIDLRPLSAQALQGGTPQGVSFVASMQPLGGTSIATSLHMSDEDATNTMRDAWQSELGYRPQGAKVVDLLWDQLTTGSDPSGASGPKPLMPTTGGQLELHVPGHSLVKSEGFEWGKHAHTNRVRDLLRRDFEQIWERTNGHDHCRRCLDFTCKKYGVDDWHEFVPKRLHSHVPGRLPHATTITESFDRADSTTIIGNDLTWTQVSGTWGTFSNTGYKVATFEIQQSARAESDLSSDDHYCQAVVANATNSTAHGPTCRYAAGAETYYSTNNFADQQYIMKLVAGTQTNLANAAHAYANGETLKVEADGSSLKGYANGAEVVSVTDSSITGNTRCGLTSYGINGTFNNWESADLGGGGGTVYDPTGGQLNDPIHGGPVPA